MFYVMMLMCNCSWPTQVTDSTSWR